MHHSNWRFDTFRCSRVAFVVLATRRSDGQVVLIEAVEDKYVKVLSERDQEPAFRTFIPVAWRAISAELRAQIRATLSDPRGSD